MKKYKISEIQQHQSERASLEEEWNNYCASPRLHGSVCRTHQTWSDTSLAVEVLKIPRLEHATL